MSCQGPPEATRGQVHASHGRLSLLYARIYKGGGEIRRPHLSQSPDRAGGRGGLQAGAVGFFSYDTVRYIEEIPESVTDDLSLPDFDFALYDATVAGRLAGLRRSLSRGPRAHSPQGQAGDQSDVGGASDGRRDGAA